MEFGSQQSLNLRKTQAVERCMCPTGYKGLSCETCDYGYTRQNSTLYRGQCVKCNCNGHAASCDAYTLQCGVSPLVVFLVLIFQLYFIRTVSTTRKVNIANVAWKAFTGTL